MHTRKWLIARGMMGLATGAAAMADFDFGLFRDNQLRAHSNQLFGIVEPLESSSTESVTASTAENDPTSLVTVAKHLRVRVVTAAPNAGANIDMIALWPDDRNPTHLIVCNEQGPAQPGLATPARTPGRTLGLTPREVLTHFPSSSSGLRSTRTSRMIRCPGRGWFLTGEPDEGETMRTDIRAFDSDRRRPGRLAMWAVALLLVTSVAHSARAQTLEGRAVLPADTFSDGPTSGQFIGPANGRTPPFVGTQPVQGFSAVLRTTGGDYLAMADNGFGAKANSADFVLRVYRIRPDFLTKSGGAGRIEVEAHLTLHDPDHKVNFAIVADLPTYPGSAIPVDPSIQAGRLLTGADFDIESFRQAHDGTFWFGDEFGPFLLHTDATGKVLEAPIPLPGVQSPDNPFLGGGTPNLPRSRGFEGMAITPNGKRLYPMLEGALTTDPDQRRLIISEFDLRQHAYTERQWFYRMEATTGSGQSIGDLTAVSDHAFLVIERDSGQGSGALFKKVFLVDLDNLDADGFLVKHEVADLLKLADPHDIGGSGTGIFRSRRSLVDGELVAQSQVLEGELAVTAEQEREEPEQVEQESDHRAGIVSGSGPIDQPLALRPGF